MLLFRLSIVPSLFLLASCYASTVPSSTFEPVYMSYSALRSAAVVSEPRDIQEISRLYLYRNHIYLNARNEGIHIIDNANPKAPVNTAFIEIPGNTEINIVDGRLYADSFVDLVIFDIRDLSNIHEVNRVPGIFPHDYYQVIADSGVYFDRSEIDETRGVVVGFKRVSK